MAVVGIIGQTGGADYVKGGDVTVSHNVEGGMTDHDVVTMADGKDYRLLEITQSGTLTFDSTQITKGIFADIWLCSGGQGGITANTDGSTYVSGLGGGGAFAHTMPSIKIDGTTATIVIGAGGAANGQGGITSIGFTDYTVEAKATTASTGGRGTGAGGYGSYSTSLTRANGSTGDGKANKRPFGDTYFELHCSSAGGGGFYETSSSKCAGGAGATNGANGQQAQTTTNATPPGGVGGSGAGDGGPAQSASALCNGKNATRYGCGGGGGGYRNAGSGTRYYGTGGTGYQGVVYIRIPA